MSLSSKKGKRVWNNFKKRWEEHFILNLSSYDKYVLTDSLNLRILQIKSLRDKCNISPDDEQAEPNKHIKALEDICKQLEIEVYKNEKGS